MSINELSQKETRICHERMIKISLALIVLVVGVYVKVEYYFVKPIICGGWMVWVRWKGQPWGCG